MESGFDFSLHQGDLNVLFRLLVAALAGAVIGWNRFRAGKPAGVGTHALVALGSALFVAIPAQTSFLHGSDSFTRAIQGVATGVGFLCAGEIFRDRDTAGSRIHGLTSAAALWVTAGLGIIAGCGSGLLIVSVTAIVLLVLLVSPRLEGRYMQKPGADLQ